MFTFLGIAIATKSELIKREESVYRLGQAEGLSAALLKAKRISPRTGKPTRKYTKRK
jgi:hypothetical protein